MWRYKIDFIDSFYKSFKPHVMAAYQQILIALSRNIYQNLLQHSWLQEKKGIKIVTQRFIFDFENDIFQINKMFSLIHWSCVINYLRRLDTRHARLLRHEKRHDMCETQYWRRHRSDLSPSLKYNFSFKTTLSILYLELMINLCLADRDVFWNNFVVGVENKKGSQIVSLHRLPLCQSW